MPRRSVKLSLRTREIDCLEYAAGANPPILHREETFLTSDVAVHSLVDNGPRSIRAIEPSGSKRPETSRPAPPISARIGDDPSRLAYPPAASPGRRTLAVPTDSGPRTA